jgi:aldose 1-epimerase
LYYIKLNQDLKNDINYLEIEDSEKVSYAKIFLNLGGSLQELILNQHHIIKDLHPLTYDNTYASSILFPFANRIADGSYIYEEKPYQFEINLKAENNALHGLIYNKTFQIVSQKTTNNYAEVTLRYQEKQLHTKGFPYNYSIDIKYTLTSDNLDLNVTVKNTDTKAFPFTLGWHPYFNSTDLFKSSVHFDSNKKVLFDQRNITVGINQIEMDNKFLIENQSLDDCFVLNSNKISFETPSYNFVLTSSEKECFLQLYTPPHANTIAIEPTTGISDSFNNKIGLKTLQPNCEYGIHWNLKINEFN